jgi:hypothetical protein
MNNKTVFALLAIGLIAGLGIAASDCIHLYTKDKNNEGIEGARVYLDSSSNFVGETDSNGYLLIPLDNLTLEETIKTGDNIWNITTSKGSKAGWGTVIVPPGECVNVTISMIY